MLRQLLKMTFVVLLTCSNSVIAVDLPPDTMRQV